MLRDAFDFNTIGPKLNEWFLANLEDKQAGVLVSHNTVTDIQFLSCEYLRANLRLPAKIQIGLDTCETMKRFASVSYRKVPASEWPELTKTGNPSMGVKPCAVYALGRRSPPEAFEDVCGSHHDADADTRAVAAILFDQPQFGNSGLYGRVFNSRSKCFQPLEDIWSAMKLKMKEPV